jgi:hypothetical protein
MILTIFAANTPTGDPKCCCCTCTSDAGYRTGYIDGYAAAING